MIMKHLRDTKPITYVLSKIFDACDIKFDPSTGIIYQPTNITEPLTDSDGRLIVLDIFDENVKLNKKQYVIFNPLIKIDHGQTFAFLILLSNIATDPEISEDDINNIDLIFEHNENSDGTITYFIKDQNENELGVGTHMNQQYALFMACLNYAYKGGGLAEKDINIITNIINEEYSKKHTQEDSGTKTVKNIVDTTDKNEKQDEQKIVAQNDTPFYLQNIDLPIGSYFVDKSIRYTNSYKYDPNIGESMKNDIGVNDLIRRLLGY